MILGRNKTDYVLNESRISENGDSNKNALSSGLTYRQRILGEIQGECNNVRQRLSRIEESVLQLNEIKRILLRRSSEDSKLDLLPSTTLQKKAKYRPVSKQTKGDK